MTLTITSYFFVAAGEIKVNERIAFATPLFKKNEENRLNNREWSAHALRQEVIGTVQIVIEKALIGQGSQHGSVIQGDGWPMTDYPKPIAREIDEGSLLAAWISARLLTSSLVAYWLERKSLWG